MSLSGWEIERLAGSAFLLWVTVMVTRENLISLRTGVGPMQHGAPVLRSKTPVRFAAYIAVKLMVNTGFAILTYEFWKQWSLGGLARRPDDGAVRLRIRG